MVDKIYCMSSYLAFRYIERDNADFYEGMHHSCIKSVPAQEKILVRSEEEVDAEIQKVFDKLKGQRLGLFLSGDCPKTVLVK